MSPIASPSSAPATGTANAAPDGAAASFTCHILGVGFWSPTLANWRVACGALAGQTTSRADPQPIPAPTQLQGSERRRAAQTVSLALAASQQAVDSAGIDPRELLAVFASAHGDLPVIDHLCSTLVHTPTLVSPTRFLQSIHNAPAGTWSLLAHNHLANTAVSAAAHSFAAGWLEAAVLVETERRPVLLVAYDTAAVGALTHTTASRGALAVALVLAPDSTPGHPMAHVHWQLRSGAGPATPCTSAAGRALGENGMAHSLPFFEALAQLEQPRAGASADQPPAPWLLLPTSAHQHLHMTLAVDANRPASQPWAPAR